MDEVLHVAELCPLIYKASWARTLIGLCGGSASLALHFAEKMLNEIEAYFKEMGVLEVTLRGIERESNRYLMAVSYTAQFGMEYQPEVGNLVDADFYYY